MGKLYIICVSLAGLCAALPHGVLFLMDGGMEGRGYVAVGWMRGELSVELRKIGVC